jgi:hypothetical protein
MISKGDYRLTGKTETGFQLGSGLFVPIGKLLFQFVQFAAKLKVTVVRSSTEVGIDTCK